MYREGKKVTDFGVVHFSPKMVLSVGTTHLHVQTAKFLRMVLKCLTSSLSLESPCWGMAQEPVDHVLKHGHHTGTAKGSCATRGGLLSPSHRKPKHEPKGFASSNATKANLLHPSQGDAKFLFLVQRGFFCFNNRTRKSQAQAFIQLCCRRSNTAPNHEHKGILSGTALAPSKRAQPCSKQVWTLRNCVRLCGMLWGWTLKNDVAFVGRKSK